MTLNWEKSVFVLISVGFVLSSGNEFREEGEREASDRGLWFGPRLGKRAPDQDNRDLYLRLMGAADAVQYYYNQLPAALTDRSEPDTRVTKKVIFTPKLGRSVEERALDFTPRLGRELADTAPERHHSEEERSARTRYYSARLGRTMNFSPRLGRELVYDNYPESVRVARSINKTKKSEH